MKDQKTPEEILKKHHLLVISDTEGFLHALKDDIVSAMQEYAQTISEGKDREIAELKVEIGELKQVLNFAKTEIEYHIRDNSRYSKFNFKQLLEKNATYQKILAALNTVH